MGKRRYSAGFWLLAVCLGTSCVRPAAVGPLAAESLAVGSLPQRQAFLRYQPRQMPSVSAHRGGPADGFPENCLATFDHTLSQTPAIIEFDVQLSKDDSLVVMHDNTLDRTSTGTGHVRDYTYAQLRQLRLEDNRGSITPHVMPTLSEVLQWAKGKTMLTVDVKSGVPAEHVVSALRRHYAQAYALVITYNLEQLKTYYRLDSTLAFTTSIRNVGDLHALERSGVPLSQVIAFMGLREPDPKLYAALHERGVKCMLGTMPMEKQKPAADFYVNLATRGADIFATDRPVEAAASLRTHASLRRRSASAPAGKP